MRIAVFVATLMFFPVFALADDADVALELLKTAIQCPLPEYVDDPDGREWYFTQHPIAVYTGNKGLFQLKVDVEVVRRTPRGPQTEKYAHWLSARFVDLANTKVSTAIPFWECGSQGPCVVFRRTFGC